MRTSGLLLGLLALCVAVPAQAQQFGGSVALGADHVIVGRTANTSQSGVLYVFGEDNQGTWTEQARLSASDADGNDDRFGRAIVAKDGRLLVGATTSKNTLGAAYIFERDASGTWSEVAALRASDGVESDHMGRAVALAGDFALVSAAGKAENAGGVYVFKRNASGAWSEHSQLAASDAAPETYFGLALAADGDHAFVGVPNADSLAGIVYVYRYDAASDTWNETQKLEGAERSRLGAAMTVQGNVAVVGAPQYEGNIGTAFVYEYDADEQTWNQTAMLLPFDGQQGQLGSAVAINGNEVWAGSPGANGFRGAVYMYQKNADGTWTGAKKLMAKDNSSTDFFGNAIDLNGDRAVVGMIGADFNAGSALVFERDASGTWNEVATLVDESTERFASITGSRVPCSEGEASAFGCNQVDMLSFLSVKDIGGGRGVNMNDVWGWTDPQSGKEYALAGRMDGTAFIDLSDPYNPVYLGSLPLTDGANGSGWRDIKVYKDHAFVVADNAGQHGIQVFDLTRLRNVSNPPMTFDEDALYTGIASAHNIVINEETGFAYAVGSSSGGETCGGGLHMVNIQDPKNPTFAGCFGHTGTGNAGTGYSHDAQCVTYSGPDAEYQGHEICFGSNETALSIADVSDKDNPKPLSQAAYPNVGYAHQGWLTEDQRFFYMNDEGDEGQGTVAGTRTLIWDVSDLDDPILVKEYISDNTSIDHNLYIKGNLMYQSNYTSGLRIFDISDPANPVSVGYFDTVPEGEDAPVFDGSWSNYPYFESGTIVVTSIREGVFFLKRKEIDL